MHASLNVGYQGKSGPGKIHEVIFVLFIFDCLTLKPFKKVKQKKTTNKKKLKRENDETKKESSRSVTKFRSDDINYDITRRNFDRSFL